MSGRRAMGFLVLASLWTLASQTAFAEDKGVYGYWKHVDEETGQTQSIFKLWEYQGKLVGKIVKIFPTKSKPKPQATCTECSGSQKDKKVEGILFFWNFVRDEENKLKWVDGKVLNPEDGNVYNCEATLSEDGKKLNVFGYVRLLVKIGGTSVWQRPTAADLKLIGS